MKILIWIIGIVIGLFTIIYVVAFTGFGNGMLKPIIESKIKEQTKMDSKVSVFQLSMSQFEILLEINKNNTIHLNGNYSLFSQAFNINYALKLEELASLEPLTKQKLIGNFRTDGNAVGDMAFLTVEGKSDVAYSKTTYNVELTDLNPTSIIAKMDNADLEALLKISGQKPYASSKINLDVNFKNINPQQLDGDITLKTKGGKIDTALMKSDFGINLPKTTFLMTLDATLKGDNVVYNYLFNSNLANITSSGNIIPEPLKAD
ncbi:MAG: AsmA-like C-terminal region-containing protein, partial [Sulfurimonas sp.]|nr:AsmA-like C-terminal region-containing protein [Sulfurimonas sp.]